MGRPLSTAAERTVRDLWATRLRVPPATFDVPGTTFVERAADFPAVVVVELGGAVVVTGPPSALVAVRDLTSEQLLDGSALVRALDAHAPSLVGLAALSYADAGTVAAPPAAEARAASEADLAEVLSRCSDDERDECGLDGATTVLVLTDRDGRPVAAAGYEVWDDAVAHVGVAVARDRRGQGLAQVVAGAATHHAIAAGLVAQWRARPENVTSTRVADRLGYARRGTQVALDLPTTR